ncbi:hypothetical protein NEHOM01_2532, partial [Nematocida homosporus]|uniref:uncharacterized protein n=1 Tax=Nematocida homosporus TaxID=1912981 RepID=UPI002220B462
VNLSGTNLKPQNITVLNLDDYLASKSASSGFDPTLSLSYDVLIPYLDSGLKRSGAVGDLYIHDIPRDFHQTLSTPGQQSVKQRIARFEQAIALNSSTAKASSNPSITYERIHLLDAKDQSIKGRSLFLKSFPQLIQGPYYNPVRRSQSIAKNQ